MAPVVRRRPRPFLLLVCPHVELLLAARRVLREAGFSVAAVSSGPEARDYLREGGPADLVVLGPGVNGGSISAGDVQRIRPGLRVLLYPGESPGRGVHCDPARLVAEVRRMVGPG